MFGHTHKYYLNYFNKYNLPIRTNKINSRKYFANFSYFNIIDNTEKAYWLGYIYADGYVVNNSGRKKFGMTLSKKDRDQLKKLNKCLNSTYPIHDYITSNGYKIGAEYSRLLIDSEELFEGLNKHGVVPNKTNIIKPPRLKYDLIPAFILGYFDGDGSVYLNNSKYPFYTINITGTDDLLRYIHNYFVDIGVVNRGISLEKRQKGQIVSYIRYGGNNLVSNILGSLYSNTPLWLPLKRKYELYIKCKERNFSRL